MKEIRWGVLGCGHIANTFMRSIDTVQDTSVIACAARDENRAKAFANKYEIANAYANYQDMLEQREINLVYIATTHNFHFEHIMMCLKMGKHVLCEKPLCLNTQQAEQAYGLAEQNRLLLVEAVWTRFLPAIIELQKVLANGIIGNIQCLQANFSLNRDLPETHRLLNPNLAGGALLDLGIYPITMADICFAKKPKKVTCDMVKSTTQLDLNSFYTLHYDNGRVAQLSAGSRMSGPTFANIMGNKGSIYLPFFLGAKSFTVTLEGKEPREHFYDYAEGSNFSFEIEHMCDALRKGETVSSIMPKDISLRVLSIMDEIRQKWALVYPNE